MCPLPFKPPYLFLIHIVSVLVCFPRTKTWFTSNKTRCDGWCPCFSHSVGRGGGMTVGQPRLQSETGLVESKAAAMKLSRKKAGIVTVLSIQGLIPTQQTTGNWRKLGAGEVVFSGEAHTNWLPIAKQSALKTYIQLTYRVHIIFSNIYVYTCNNNQWKKRS